jgi:hypothetical protein
VTALLTDLEDFFRDHRLHGPLTADATEPAWNGYLLDPVDSGFVWGLLPSRGTLRGIATR